MPRRKLLQIVLRLGNFINGGSNKGGAYGVSFGTLMKLRTVKSSDNKMTLLHYVVTLAEAKYPDVYSICVST